jgi:hypothetical protein
VCSFQRLVVICARELYFAGELQGSAPGHGVSECWFLIGRLLWSARVGSGQLGLARVSSGHQVTRLYDYSQYTKLTTLFPVLFFRD